MIKVHILKWKVFQKISIKTVLIPTNFYYFCQMNKLYKKI